MKKQISNVLVFGSIGVDAIDTPFGSAKNILGGSATYASLAASYFSQPILLASCGTDLTKKELNVFDKHNIVARYLRREGKTFRWHGKYDLDGRVETLSTEFNEVINQMPNIPKNSPRFVLLANHNPEFQLKILDQLPKNTFTIADTIEFWINSKRDIVKKVFSKVAGVSITDTEAKLLAGTSNTILSGKFILSLNPKSRFVVLKKGEHGALTFFPNGKIFSAPAYPLEVVRDPTGAGDSLAGGLIGYLASQNKIDEKTVRKGIVYGSAISSFVAESLGVGYRNQTTREAIESRFSLVKSMRIF